MQGAEVQQEIVELRKEVRELRESVADLVLLWRAATGALKIVKWFSVVGGGLAAIFAAFHFHSNNGG